jgi:hypothetical protein
MRRLLRVLALPLGTILLCGACSHGGTNVFAVDVTTGESFGAIGPDQWISCTDSGGCVFRGQGQVDGGRGTADQVCTSSVTGAVSFTSADSVFLSETPAAAAVSYGWRMDPDPKATVRSGDTFSYVTTARVPRTVVDKARRYVSTVHTADLRGC